ncbi:MAG TPA: mechanosensitive ion channel [Candidatus Enterocloster excrementipullorum]|uniref:Mechanosensitive ion channel n=1 Tax=Candidatus Enterocloster excrementipullorum TaxID=2838559 RepID=A0A9D2SFZ5_9FIRM|nr:mechanosensitive ion channel [Candidatus Enterocloster excrementipullorum]
MLPAAEQVKESLHKFSPEAVKETLQSWIPGLLALGIRLAVAALIIFIGSRVAKGVKKFLRKTFQRMELDLGVSKFLLSVAEVCIYAIAVFIAADNFGIPSASIVALLGSAGLAIGLSLKDSLANVAGGILILLMRPFTVNDYIIFEDMEGTVQNIGLVYTTLAAADNKKITIPNGSISNGAVINVTAQEKRRVDIEVGIGYTSDMKKAKEILYRIFESEPRVLKEEGITVYVGQLADSAVIIGGRGWTKTDDYWSVRWGIIESIKEEFDKAGIEIPYNQLDVNLKRAEK